MNVLEATKLAIDNKLSREVRQVSTDKVTKEHRVGVCIFTAERQEMDYYFISGKPEAEAIATAKIFATAQFLNIVELAIVKEEPTPPQEGTKAREQEVAEEKAKIKAATKAKPAPAAKKSKNVPYDRENKDHKKEFGDVVESIIPSWGEHIKKDSDLLQAISGLSRSLNGTDFIGGTKKEVLKSFIDAIVDVLTPFVKGNEACVL